MEKTMTSYYERDLDAALQEAMEDLNSDDRSMMDPEELKALESQFGDIQRVTRTHQDLRSSSLLKLVAV
jgi:hypothetical protein